ncbi:unnamed protein product [Closterium sp. Yama58-4]|nr:unnamed protein product [Closterium sp. Yama58-4]
MKGKLGRITVMVAVRVSVDLVAAAQQQFRLLRAVDCCAGLYSGPAVRRAIRRYERCWLPLLDELQGGRLAAASRGGGEAELPSYLVPPLDVHWIWLCHRLAPQQQQQAEAVAVSRRVWNERWPGDPYDLHFFQPAANTAAGAAASLSALHLPPSLLGASSSSHSTLRAPSPGSPPAAAAAGAPGSRAEPEEAGESTGGEAAAASVQERISYDLEAAVARQARFYHQIARPHMQDAKYLLGAVERYKAFLWLVKHHLPAADSAVGAAAGAGGGGAAAGGGGGDGSGGAGSMFIPALDIDFVWHAHQPLSVQLNTPPSRFHTFVHNKIPLSLNLPRFRSHKIIKPLSATWLGFYGRPYARAGTIRKEPPPPPFPFPPPLKSKPGGGGGSGAGSATSAASSNPGSHIPSGNSSRGTSKIASPVSSPGASPMQETRGDLRAGIPPRHVFDATLSLLSVASLPASLKGDLSLQISALSACPSLRLRSHKLPLPLPLPSPSSTSSQSLPPNEHPWPGAPTWWLSLDVETKGVVLQLLLEPPKGRLSGIAGMAGMGGAHKARSLGEATVLWSDVFGAKDLSWHGALALGSGAAAGGKGSSDNPHVRIHVSVTPPQPAPVLLMLQPAVGTDDTGLQLTAVAAAVLKQQQEGRWMARTVVDHTLTERFVLRTRVAKGHGSQQVEVPPESKRVLLHRGGWSPSPKVKGVLVAAGERVDEVCQLRTHHTMATQRTWMAYSGWTLQVSLRHSHLPSASSLPSSASLSASASSSSASSPAFPGLRFHVAKVPGPPMALAPGRRLAYSRPRSSLSPPTTSSSTSTLLRSSSTASAAAAHAFRGERGGAGGGAMGGEGGGEDREGEEAGYVTVVRYPEDCPGGVATALFNWRTGGIEVQPHERLDVVALMAVAVAQSWHDLHLAATTAGSASAASAAKKKGAGSASAKPAPVKITPSKLPRRAASLGKDDRWGSVVVDPSPPEAMSPDPPLHDWFMSRMLMWHDSPLYNTTDVGGSCAALLGGSACGPG